MCVCVGGFQPGLQLTEWLLVLSGDYKDVVWFYSRMIWPLFAFSPLSVARRGGADRGVIKILGSCLAGSGVRG